jgi:hypothetical protein
MAIEKNLPLDDYLGIDSLSGMNTGATAGVPQGAFEKDGPLGGGANRPASETQPASDYLGTQTLGGAGIGIAVDPVTASTASTATTDPVKPKLISTYTDDETGDVIDVYEDGTEAIRKKGTVKLDATKAAEATAAATLAKKVSAFDILRREFTAKGLGFLVEAAENAIMNEDSDAGRLLALRNSPAYQLRFSANAERIKKGLTALDEATYLGMEDQYQEVMRQYGLPASYYAKDATGKQAGFEQLLANDVSNIELGDRLMVAQDRVLKSNPEVLSALKGFYPDITNGDILAYTLDPKNAIKEIQRKVTTAEIGGAAVRSGLKTNVSDAEYLQRYGVTKETADQGYATIAGGLQRGSQLASIYGEDPYTQATAETEVFNVPGAQEARKQRQRITGLEKATFSGQSGLTQGALARDRAGGY